MKKLDPKKISPFFSEKRRLYKWLLEVNPEIQISNERQQPPFNCNYYPKSSKSSEICWKYNNIFVTWKKMKKKVEIIEKDDDEIITYKFLFERKAKQNWSPVFKNWTSVTEYSVAISTIFILARNHDAVDFELGC